VSYYHPGPVITTAPQGSPSWLRQVAALLFTASLAVVLLPAVTRAADNVQLTVTTEAIPDTATLSTSDVKTYVAYQVSFSNDNQSTLTQTRLRVGKPSIDGSAVRLYDVYPPNLAKACETNTGGLAADCQFGQVKPGRNIAMTFLFQVPAIGDAQPGSDLVFAKSDTVLTIKEGESDAGANQDTWYADSRQVVHLVSVPVDAGGSKVDYFATYTPASGGTWGTNGTDIERDTTQLGTGNDQATKVVVPSTSQGTKTVLREISPAGNFGCPEAGACFGDVSELTVPGIGSKTITVFIRWDDSALPNGMTPRKLRVAWDPDDGGPIPAQIVETACNRNASNAPCRYAAVRFGDKDLGVMLVLPHNGRVRGM
jgi:hypothetical protein